MPPQGGRDGGSYPAGSWLTNLRQEKIEIKGVMTMTKANGVAGLIAFMTLAVCVAAIFDPRFRKACLSLLCKL